ncbi:putative leucine-rich repeat-containing protein DDB_G0290503 isoform X5 [Maniola hyperantus]|uniref:putative leucine-rich repeat-containing protein DDB_G0290503 isoform X5 n=1 Tax=Aphantopus hyperantus TaxID=2795564 RepID=UPI0037490AC6
MRLLILIASSWALVASKPEIYKEKEDFQYSRSSSDDGSKSGYYGAQRGNMGGNYERAHNMDSLAQHQMSTLVRNVDGELGEGANTKTGSVFAAANSRGLYGSGNYDLSNLRGRNFGEGTISGDSLSQSASSQKSGYSDYSRYENSYSAANKHSSSRAQNSGHSSGFQSSGLASQYLQTDAQKAADNIYGARNYEYDSQGANNYKYAQSSSQARSDYENSNSANANSDHKTSSSLIYATPVRVYVRPGTRIAIPVAAQVYDTNAVQGLNTVHSDSEILDTNGQRVYYKPTNNAKHYESSYSYRKEWEKQNSIPVTVGPTESPFPTNSELYEDAHLSQLANSQYESDLASAVNSHASSANSAYLSGYSGSTKNALSSQSRHQSQAYNSGASALNAYNYGASASNAYKSGASDSSAYTHNAYDAAAANLLSSHISDGTVNSNNLVEGIDSKPKSYHSSYSYHKSWERRGDPYIIKPVGGEQASQRLTAASAKQGYACTYCLDDSQQRVRRSITTDDQQSDNLHDGQEDMGQQSIHGWQDSEDLGQQTQNKWDELGSFNQQPQSQLGNLEDLGQQTQNQWDKLEGLSQQPQTQDQLEDLGQQTQSHWGKLEDLDQKPQTQQRLEDLGQQIQNQWDNHGDLNQQTQAYVGKLEDLGQQTQSHWGKLEDLDQKPQTQQRLEDLGQQIQNQWDNLGDLNQQTQAYVGKLEDLGQQTETQWDKLGDLSQQTQSHWEDLGQQTQSKLDNLEKVGQQSQNKWSYLDNLGQQENLGQQGQSQNVANFGQETQNTANGYGGYQFYKTWTVDGRFVPSYTNYRDINGLPYYVQDPLENINKRWDCHNLEHGSYFHHHNIDLKESQFATHNSDFLFNVNHLEPSEKPKQNTAQNSGDKPEIDINIQRETTTVNYVTSDEKTPETTQKTINTDEDQDNSSTLANIHPIDIGRGDIGPEDTSIETTNINEKNYKTPEEIESLSLTKDQIDISKEPLNLSVTSLHEQNKQKNLKELSSVIESVTTSTTKPKENLHSKIINVIPIIDDSTPKSHFLSSSGNHAFNDQQNELKQIPASNEQQSEKKISDNFGQHNWVQQTQSLDQQNMEQYLEPFKNQDVAQQLDLFEEQNMRQDVQSFEEQNMVQQSEFFEKQNLGQHLEHIGEKDMVQQLEPFRIQNLGQDLKPLETKHIGQQFENVEQHLGQQNVEQHLEPFEEQNMELLQTIEQLETNQKIAGQLQNSDTKNGRKLLDIPEEHTVRMNSQDDFDQQVQMSADKNILQNSQTNSKRFKTSPDSMYVQEQNIQYKSQNVEPTKSHDDISPPIEPTTEKPGFWGKVWNKTKHAKESVVSWFSS